MSKKFSSFTLQKEPAAYTQAITVIENANIRWLTYRDYDTVRQRQIASMAYDCTIISHHYDSWSRLIIPAQTIWTQEGNKILTATRTIVWRWYKNFQLITPPRKPGETPVTVTKFRTGTEYLSSTFADQYE